MNDLRQFYRDALPARITALENARAGGTDAVRSIAHSLRGSGATYGFPEVTTAAASVEDAAPGDIMARLDELLAVLRTAAAE